MSLSRRDFLRLIGASTGAALIQSVPLGWDGEAQDTVDESAFPLGRVIYPTSIMAAADRRTPVRTVWEDEVIPIWASFYPGWMQTNEGLIAAEAVHPLSPNDEGDAGFSGPLPCSAEVSAGIASVYAWCSADAPLATRIGGGGAAWIVDTLQIGGTTWLGIATAADADVIGWSDAQRWRRTAPNRRLPLAFDRLIIDQPRRTLSAYRGQQVIIRAKTAAESHVPTGAYEVKYGAVCASEQYPIGQQSFASGLIVPYPVWFDDHVLAGAYWHNCFGQSAVGRVPEGCITVHPYIARLLYAGASSGTPVIVT